MTDQQRIAELEIQRDKLRSELSEGMRRYAADVQKLRAENAQLAAMVDGFQKHYQIARGRVMANFAHVPEAVRVVEWMDHEMHDALSQNPSTALRELLEPTIKTLRTAQLFSIKWCGLESGEVKDEIARLEKLCGKEGGGDER